MTVYTLTLASVRTRVEHKLRDNQSSDRVDEWINDVVQAMTAEVFFDELYAEGTITGDGLAQEFDLTEDHGAFSWVYSTTRDQPLEEVSPRELMEDFPSSFDGNVQTPMVYCPLGRTGTAGVNNVPLLVVKFDSIVPSAEVVDYGYYSLHADLTSDTDVILLPQNLLATIVDGVLMEADSWSDSDQFAVHRDRFIDKMNQLKRNQNRRPNKRRGIGRSSRSGRPGRPSFPSGYPDVHGQG